MKLAPLDKLHVTVLVYGRKYVDVFSSIVLPNLAGLIDEIPEVRRKGTRLRILTDGESETAVRTAPMLKEIAGKIAVEIAADMVHGGLGQYGTYGPMILGQSRLVREASREGAGIIFCPPDLVWSAGAFAAILDLADRGCRAVIGPSARGIEEDLLPELRQRIERHPEGKLVIPAGEMTGLLLDHWNQLNDGYIWNRPGSNYWKAFSFYQLSKRHFLMRFHQGPMMYARPFREVVGYDGWIDHRLIKQCVRSMREVHVIDDAMRLQTIDFAPRSRVEGLEPTAQPKRALFRQLMNRKRHCRFNVLYGAYTCRIYDQPLSEATWRRALWRYDLQVLPVIYAAFLARPVAAVGDGIWRHLRNDRRLRAVARWFRNTKKLFERKKGVS